MQTIYKLLIYSFLNLLFLASVPCASCEEPTPTIKPAASTAPEPSPLKQYGTNVTRGLIITVCVLLIGARLYKAYTAKQERPEERIQIKARRNVNPRSQLVIVEVDDTEFLLSVTAEQVSLLGKLDTPLTPHSPGLAGTSLNVPNLEGEGKHLEFSQIIAKRMGEG